MNDFRNTQVAIEECRRRCRVSCREHYGSPPTVSPPRKRKSSKAHPMNSSSSPTTDYQEMRQEGLYGEIQQSHAFDQIDDDSITSDYSEQDERDERSYNFKIFSESEKENRHTSFR